MTVWRAATAALLHADVIVAPARTFSIVSISVVRCCRMLCCSIPNFRGAVLALTSGSQKVGMKKKNGQPPWGGVGVVSGGDPRHKIKSRYNEYALSAISYCNNPGQVAPVEQGTPLPPKGPVSSLFAVWPQAR